MTHRHRGVVRGVRGLVAAALLAAAGCAATGDSTTTTTPDDTTTPTPDDETDVSTDGSTDGIGDDPTPQGTDGTSAAAPSDLGGVGTLDSAVAHEISVELDPDDYDAMIATYQETGDKTWIEATVTIDGTTYERVGLRLKGNSSLFGIGGGDGGGQGGRGPSSTASVDRPETLPWLIDLDKYVDGQQHDGLVELVVRSNTTETALNEAVALELLQLAGLAAQDAIATGFSVNGSDPVLRLVIDHPDDAWMAEELSASGALYKAESGGDYSYRGDDPEAYDDVFDQEAGADDADLTPLIEFLAWLDESDDATFAAELDDWLDVDAFVTYLAMQELIDNADDIDGPGNNSYLFWDGDRFTVVAWDHNLAFGGMGGGDRPTRPGAATADQTTGGGPAGPGGGGPPGGADGGRGGNVLAERFLAVDEWSAAVDAAGDRLRSELVTSGVAAGVLAVWSDVVASTGLVDDAVIAQEAAAVAAYF